MSNNTERMNAAVTIVKHDPDWNDLEWHTMTLLGAKGLNPGPSSEIALRFKEMILSWETCDTMYVNPRFVVSAPDPCATFLRESHRAQLDWLRSLKNVFGSAGKRKRQMKAADLIKRQLCFTGVMIIEGKYYPPTDWVHKYKHLLPSAKKKGRPPYPARQELQDQRFGRLVVQHHEHHDYWLCLCDCGQIKSIKRCHLQAGRVKSCGCLKSQHEESQQARKVARGQ